MRRRGRGRQGRRLGASAWQGPLAPAAARETLRCVHVQAPGIGADDAEPGVRHYDAESVGAAPLEAPRPDPQAEGPPVLYPPEAARVGVGGEAERDRAEALPEQPGL